MKFSYDGDYTCVDGYTFFFHNPVTVENKATIAKLEKDPHFTKVEEQKDRDACPKCGRIVKQGKVMHIRWCKGK